MTVTIFHCAWVSCVSQMTLEFSNYIENTWKNSWGLRNAVSGRACDLHGLFFLSPSVEKYLPLSFGCSRPATTVNDRVSIWTRQTMSNHLLERKQSLVSFTLEAVVPKTTKICKPFILVFEFRTYSSIARHGFCMIYSSLEDKAWPAWEAKDLKEDTQDIEKLVTGRNNLGENNLSN